MNSVYVVRYVPRCYISPLPLPLTLGAVCKAFLQARRQQNFFHDFWFRLARCIRRNSFHMSPARGLSRTEPMQSRSRGIITRSSSLSLSLSLSSVDISSFMYLFHGHTDRMETHQTIVSSLPLLASSPRGCCIASRYLRRAPLAPPPSLPREENSSSSARQGSIPPVGPARKGKKEKNASRPAAGNVQTIGLLRPPTFSFRSCSRIQGIKKCAIVIHPRPFLQIVRMYWFWWDRCPKISSSEHGVGRPHLLYRITCLFVSTDCVAAAGRKDQCLLWNSQETTPCKRRHEASPRRIFAKARG